MHPSVKSYIKNTSWKKVFFLSRHSKTGPIQQIESENVSVLLESIFLLSSSGEEKLQL